MASDLTPPPNMLMALSQALRQAAIDVPKDLPEGARFATATARDTAGVLVVTVTAKDAHGDVVWTAGYDASGRRR